MVSSLVKRIITAGILIPAVVVAVFFLPTAYLAICFAVIALMGGLEWSDLAGISSRHAKISYLLLISFCLWGAYQLTVYPWFRYWFFLIVVIMWLIIAISLFGYTHIKKAAPGVGVVRLLMGPIILTPLWTAIVVLHGYEKNGPLYVFFLLILIWVADSGAYFVGRRWGKNKLAPVISPGKTWEGVYGALFGAIACGLILSWYQSDIDGIYWLVPVCVFTVLMSVVGDLFESVMKRTADMKDSGNLLPGHGGVMDRIDSLTAAAPVFLLGLQIVIGS